jgi:hypothetical protein
VVHAPSCGDWYRERHVTQTRPMRLNPETLLNGRRQTSSSLGQSWPDGGGEGQRDSCLVTPGSPWIELNLMLARVPG